MRKIALAGVLSIAAVMPAFASPTVIVIEPDDFAPGAQITSPDATVSYFQVFNPTPVLATGVPGDAFPAPTGELTFGTSALTFFPGEDLPFTGLYFKFNAPVSSVSIWALNSGYPPGLSIDCGLWLTGGSRTSCDGQSYTMALGEAHRYTLDFGGQAFDAIGFGGDDSISRVVFDRLEATLVPEPMPAALLAIGAAGLLLRRRFVRSQT